MTGIPAAAAAPAAAAPAVAAPAAPAAIAAPISAPAAFDWSTSGVSAENLPAIQAKGFGNTNDMATSYFNLEKLMGGGPDSLVKLPKDDAPAADWGPVYDRLGRPKTAAEYKLPTPTGQGPEFAAEVSGWFHEAGVSQKAGAFLAEKWNAKMGGAMAASTAATQTAIKAEDTALRTEQGANYDAFVAQGRNACQAFGIDKAALDKLQTSLGYTGLIKLMQSVGSKLGVAQTFVQGEGGQQIGFTMTDVQAKQKITELQVDKGFSVKFAKGDSDARRQMADLHKIAYPGQTMIGVR